MKVDQGQVTTAIATGRSAAHGDDSAAAEALRLARLGAPAAVTFLLNVVRAEQLTTSDGAADSVKCTKARKVRPTSIGHPMTSFSLAVTAATGRF
jgi:hypothetical protein